MIIRNIEQNDYDKGYMNLMKQFTNFDYNISKEQFTDYLHRNHKHIRIIVIEDNGIIIGAGSIFKLEKLHNNPVGQIEDIIIDKRQRGKGYGKAIVERLVDIGKNEFKAYKIILNCLDENIEFYNKCGFKLVGNEMKLTFN